MSVKDFRFCLGLFGVGWLGCLASLGSIAGFSIDPLLHESSFGEFEQIDGWVQKPPHKS
jgi:hypothetical protein